MKEHLGVKIDAKLKARMQNLVDEGEFASLSELTNQAIQYFLTTRKDEIDKETVKALVRGVLTYLV